MIDTHESVETVSFRRLLKQSIFAPIVFSVFLAVLLVWQVHTLIKAVSWVQHTDQVLAHAQVADKLLSELQSSVRGYYTTNNAQFIEPFRTAKKELPSVFARLNLLVAENESQQAFFLKLGQLYSEWVAIADAIMGIEDSGSGAQQDYERIVVLKEKMDSMDALFSEFVRRELRIRETRAAAFNQKAQAALLGSLGFTLFLGLLIALFVRRRVLDLMSLHFSALRKEQMAKRRIQDSELRSQKDLEKILEERELREKFVATLSHDLRNPLTAARVAAQVLQRSGVGERAEKNRELVEKLAYRITASIDRADHMIENLLDANRIQAGQALPITVEACHLNDLVSEVIEELSLIHGARFRILADEPIYGYWSKQAMRRSLENLLNNAVKYGEANMPITLSLKVEDEDVCICVHNYGEALSSEEQRLIFEPFRRTASADNGTRRGWGLGLTLVRGLTRAHGGDVSVSSQQGQGTSFTIRIPLDARLSVEASTTDSEIHPGPLFS